MRRLLMIFLLFALPLQVSWAAVASYCKHEAGAAAKHFGHHEHQHHAQKAEPAKKDGANLSADNDCMVCHLAAAGMMPTSIANTASKHQGLEPHDADARFFRLLPPDRPERPNWARAI
jgi:hypothetical protein